MIALARSATDFPFKLTIPNSVTTYITSERGVVTMLPGVSVNTMRLRRSPLFWYVDERHMNDLPPLDAYAPRTNCSCPPVPLMWRGTVAFESPCALQLVL